MKEMLTCPTCGFDVDEASPSNRNGPATYCSVACRYISKVGNDAVARFREVLSYTKSD